MVLTAPQLFQSFKYDFSVTGGATGTQLTGIQLPNNARVFSFALFTPGGVTAVGATITIGTATTANLFGTFAGNQTSGWFLLRAATAIVSPMDNTLNVLITISAAPITAGIFEGYFQYYMAQ